jgi:hypothetical protein
MTKIELIAALKELKIEDNSPIVIALRTGSEHDFEILSVTDYNDDYGIITVIT